MTFATIAMHIITAMTTNRIVTVVIFVGSAARAVGRMVDGGAFGAAVARFVEEVVEIVHSLLRTFYMLILF